MSKQQLQSLVDLLVPISGIGIWYISKTVIIGSIVLNAYVLENTDHNEV